VDVDAEEELASFFKIRTIPTLLFIPQNGTPQMTSGVLSKVQLQNIINDTLL
jgi:thioredoxin-like negative regulator of GroEL